jgi:ABC-type multidrug transport system fused ATPase/permease subunit
MRPDSFDKIIVMDKGSMIETGVHSTLLRKRGSYYHLYQLQKLIHAESKTGAANEGTA